MLTPFYEDERSVLYLGDATEVIPKLKAIGTVVDLLATDPPYGVKFRSNRGQNFEALVGDHSEEVGYTVCKASLDLLRPKRHLYVFGPFDLGALDKIVSAKPSLVWDKGLVGMGDLSLPWAPQHELIQFGSLIPSAKNRAAGDGGLTARMRQGSVLSVARKNSRGVKRHPTEKPVELMQIIIEASSVVGEIVFDPFAGSGSTLVAAVLSGRKAIGIEIDPGYASTAAERLAKATALRSQVGSV